MFAILNVEHSTANSSAGPKPVISMGVESPAPGRHLFFKREWSCSGQAGPHQAYREQ